MNDMNELTNKLQQVMVPKAALIAYEYRENRYGNGMHYLELHPINDRGRMEAAMPVTYEFMDSLVESYTRRQCKRLLNQLNIWFSAFVLPSAVKALC